MNKTQEKAMQSVVNHAAKNHKDLIGHIHFDGQHAYATDGYQIYRIPCTDRITLSVNRSQKYPKDNLDSFLKIDDSWDKYFLNTDVVHDNGYFKLVKIGHCYYDVKKVKKAIQILGKNIIAYQDGSKCFAGIVLESEKGNGLILPVRTY